MRRVVLSALAVPFALGAANACSGAASTGDPLNQREPAPSGTETPQSMYESPPSTWETPPSSYETPPAMGDPANQTGSPAGSCLKCSGTYSCTSSTGAEMVTLGMHQGACEAAGLFSVASVPACGTSGSSSVTVTPSAGGGFSFCLQGDASSVGCGTCTPSGGGGGKDAGTVITVMGGSGGCSALSACCGNLTGAEATACTEAASLGNSETCTTTLTELTNAGLCT